MMYRHAYFLIPFIACISSVIHSSESEFDAKRASYDAERKMSAHNMTCVAAYTSKNGPLSSIVFHPRNNTLLAGSQLAGKSFITSYHFEESFDPQAQELSANVSIDKLSVNKDGTQLISSYNTNSSSGYHLISAKDGSVQDNPIKVCCSYAAFRPRTSLVTYTANSQSMIACHDEAGCTTAFYQFKKPLTSFAYNYGGGNMAICFDKVTTIIDTENDKVIASLPHKHPTTALCFAYNDNALVTGHKNGAINVYDLRKIQPAPVATYQKPSSAAYARADEFRAITALAADPTSNHIVSTAQQDTTIKIWDITCPTTTYKPLDAHIRPVTAIAFNAQGILASAAHTTLILWERTQQKIPTAKSPVVDSE